MFELIEKIKPSKQFLQEPQILIDGNSEEGTRRIVITIPVVDESHQRIRTIVKEYSGKEFNEVYSLFVSDKALLEKVLLDMDVEVDISNLSDDLINK